MMDSTPEQKPPAMNGGDPRYGTRRSSIPFVVEFDSDEEDEPAWDHPEQAESGGESSEDHQPPAEEKSPQTPQTPQRSMRRISQISVGSDFADMAQNLDESDHNAKPKPPPFSGHHYVIPLGGLESPNQKKEKGNGSSHSRSGSNHSRSGSKHRRTGSDHSRSGSNHSRSGGRQNRQLSDSLCDVMIPPQTTLKQSQSLPVSSLQLAASRSRISSSFLESKGSRETDIYESTIQARLSRARSTGSSSSEESQTRRSQSNSSGSSKDPSSPKATYQSSLQARLSELKAQQASAEDVLRHSHREGKSRRSASKREAGRSISPIRVNPVQQPVQRSSSFSVPTHHQRRRGHYADRLKLAKQIGGAILNGDSAALEDSLHSKRSGTSEMNGNKGRFDDLGTSEHTTGDSVVKPKDNSLPEAAAAAAQTRAKLRKKHSERKDRLHRVLVKMNSAAILKSSPGAAKEISPTISPVRGLSPTRELPTRELEDTLLQPTVDDVTLNTSFRIGEGGGLFTPGQPQEDLNVKCPGKIASRDENAVAPPTSPKRFPSTVQNVGVAAMPAAGLRRTKGSLLDDDDESVGLSTIADNSVDFDTLVTKSEHSTTLDAVMKESSNQEGSSAALTTTTTLKSVASDVLLDPAKFLRRHSSTVSSSASVQTPSDDVSALTHATGLTNAQKVDRRPSLISVEETNPEEDAKTAATPFFGAALRHLQTMTAGTSDHSRTSYGSDPEEGSVTSFAGSSFAGEEDCSITSEYVASKMTGNRRGSMLGAIYEGNSGNMSLENSHTPSEALDMFEDTNINPVERKLIAQRDEMFVGRRDSMLSTTSTNSSSNSRVPRKTARRMSMGVAAPLRKNDNYQIQGRILAETGNLDNVELDHTIPPESTRTRQARRSTAGHSIASDYSHIETTSLEMANMSMAVAKIKKFSKRKRSSVKSTGSENKARRGTRDAIDLGAFAEFKLNHSTNGDDDAIQSCASSVESFITQPEKLPSQRTNSMYHYKGGNLSSEEKNEQHDRNWKALLQGHGVMLQSTGERPVLRRMYTYGAFIVCIGICLVIPLVILKGWVREDENPYPEESACRRPDLADSLQRCACNSTSAYTWDESVQSRYEDLTFLLLDQGVLDEENIPEDVESCSNENVAILWISEGDWDFYTLDVDRTVQRYVMGYFFLELGGTIWTESTLWMSESDVCDWLGLSCSGMGLTTSLHLSDNNLKGSIPSELSYISYLTKLRLDKNDNIAGTLPTTLSTLSHLYEVDLSGNGLSGNLFTGVFLGSSDSLGKNHYGAATPCQRHFIYTCLFTTEVLNISSNGLEGTIPRGFALLSKLQQLDLSSNTMGGSLPLSLGALGELRKSLSLLEQVS